MQIICLFGMAKCNNQKKCHHCHEDLHIQRQWDKLLVICVSVLGVRWRSGEGAEKPLSTGCDWESAICEMKLFPISMCDFGRTWAGEKAPNAFVLARKSLD